MPRNTKATPSAETVTMDEVETLYEKSLNDQCNDRLSNAHTHCKHAMSYHNSGLRCQLWRCWECRTFVCSKCRRENVTSRGPMVTGFRCFTLKGFDDPAMNLCKGCATYFEYKIHKYADEFIYPPVENPPTTMPEETSPPEAKVTRKK